MTTSATAPLPVVVGVDGSPGTGSGVRYAAAEATRLGVALQIVHVTPGYPAAGPVLPTVPDGSLRSYGLQLLEDATAAAQAEAADLRVDTMLLTGTAVAALAECSERASLMVLGAGPRSAVERVWTGDVVAGVVARASCPVVVVPTGWTPGPERLRVLVGVKSPSGSAALLEAGVALAHARGAELVVLHAWRLPEGYDDLVANRADSEAYGRRATAVLEPVLNELRKDRPEVPVRIEVLHAQAAWALVDASQRADRLLIERPHRGRLLHHLGPVARAVLREAHCPVEVLPPTTPEDPG